MRHPPRRRGFPPRPLSHVQQPEVCSAQSGQAGAPARENRVGESKSDEEKGGIQAATVRAPGRRHREWKTSRRWPQAALCCSCPHDTNWSSSSQTQEPAAKPRPQPSGCLGLGPWTCTRLDRIPAWPSIVLARWQLPGSRCTAGGGRGLSQPGPQVRVEGRARGGKKLVVSLALLLIKGLHP